MLSSVPERNLLSIFEWLGFGVIFFFFIRVEKFYGGIGQFYPLSENRRGLAVKALFVDALPVPPDSNTEDIHQAGYRFFALAE